MPTQAKHSDRLLVTIAIAALSLVAGCGSDDEAAAPSAFELLFAPMANGEEVGCTAQLEGLGPDREHRVGLSDLRFYVSNIQFADSKGSPLAVTLDDNEFQYNSAAGSVALIDATGNTAGSCAGSAIAFAEGTARTNLSVTGTTLVESVASISFDVGVPQAVMQETISNHSAEGAPSPLNEMYWTWASGYRHLVFNFTVENGAGVAGGGYLHVGSRDCGPPDGLALEDRAACTFVNTPRVSLEDFDLGADRVAIDVVRLLDGLDLLAPIYDAETFEVLGAGPGAECHSAPSQPDCSALFSALGVDLATGDSDASSNEVFASE